MQRSRRRLSWAGRRMRSRLGGHGAWREKQSRTWHALCAPCAICNNVRGLRLTTCRGPGKLIQAAHQRSHFLTVRISCSQRLRASPIGSYGRDVCDFFGFPLEVSKLFQIAAARFGQFCLSHLTLQVLARLEQALLIGISSEGFFDPRQRAREVSRSPEFSRL